MISIVQNLLRNDGVVGAPGIEVYLFGSLLISDKPRDIDLLLVYDPSRITVGEGMAVRRRVREAMVAATGTPADILLLSTSEMKQTGFLERVTAVKLRHQRC